MITYVDRDSEKYIFGISNYNRVLELYDKSLHKVKRIAHSSSQKQKIVFEDICNWNVKTCGTGIFHRKSLGIYWDESFRLLEDLDFLISEGKEHPDGFLHIPYALFEYRQRYNTDGQCSLSNFGDFSKAFKAIYDKHYADISLSKEAFLGRFEKYKNLQMRYESGEIEKMGDYIFS